MNGEEGRKVSEMVTFPRRVGASGEGTYIRVAMMPERGKNKCKFPFSSFESTEVHPLLSRPVHTLSPLYVTLCSFYLPFIRFYPLYLIHLSACVTSPLSVPQHSTYFVVAFFLPLSLSAAGNVTISETFLPSSPFIIFPTSLFLLLHLSDHLNFLPSVLW